MAKRNSDQDNGMDKGKIRFIYAEVEGNNQSLQDLMKTMISAMNRTSQSIPAVKQIPNTAPPSLTATDAEGTLFGADLEEGEGSEEPISDHENVPRQKRGDGPKTDRNAGLSLVADLDLMPDGKQSLKDFITEKKPGSAEEQVLIFVYYMVHTLSLSPITANHVLSCFKPVGKKVPVDLRQTIRNVAKNKAWLNTDLDNLRITTQGENHVDHVLGQSPENDDDGSK